MIHFLSLYLNPLSALWCEQTHTHKQALLMHTHTHPHPHTHTSDTVRAFPDGENCCQFLSSHWLQLQQPLPLLVSGCLAVFQQLDLRGGRVVAQEAVEEPRASVNITIILLEKLNHRNKSQAGNTDNYII